MWPDGYFPGYWPGYWPFDVSASVEEGVPIEIKGSYVHQIDLKGTYVHQIDVKGKV